MMPVQQDEEHIGGKVIEFPGAAVTWVGAAPWTGGIAYADEDGWLRSTGADGPSQSGAPYKIIGSERSVNQVAFNEHHGFRSIGACTTSNVAIHRFTKEGELAGSRQFDWGGHGIYPTRSGSFLVPRGPAGLAVLSPHMNGAIKVNIFNPQNCPYYFYLMCLIGVLPDDRELWACAGRSSGLLAVAVDRDARPEPVRCFQSTIKPKDYLGVCSIATEARPYATVSLSRNGEVDFSEDLLQDRTPLTWHFGREHGVAYSIAAASGHLLILTSKGLYVCIDQANRFLDGQLQAGTSMTTVRHLPLEIIDIAVAYDRWLLMLQPDKVVRVDVNDLLTSSPAGRPRPSAKRPTSMVPPGSGPMWADIVLQATVNELAVA